MTTIDNNQNDNNQNQDSTTPDLATRFSAAYGRQADAIAAVPIDALAPINLDVPTAITTVLAAAPRIGAYREAIASSLRDFDIAAVDELEDNALALGEAHMAWSTAATAGGSLPELLAEGTRRRDRLLLHAEALVDGGLLDKTSIDEIKAHGGYRGVAFELLSLCRLFRESWSAIGTKTAVKVSDLAESQELGDRIVQAVTARQASPKVVAEAALVRQQAFTRFVNAYEQVRRALSYLRWGERDVDAIAPSLYAGRGSGSHKPPGDDTEAEAPIGAPAPIAAPAASPTANPTAGSPTVVATSNGNGSASVVPVGFPGSNPFTS